MCDSASTLRGSGRPKRTCARGKTYVDPTDAEEAHEERRLTANLKERHRVQVVNRAYANLMEKLPPPLMHAMFTGKKMVTKVDILNAAGHYIHNLQVIMTRLHQVPEGGGESSDHQSDSSPGTSDQSAPSGDETLLSVFENLTKADDTTAAENGEDSAITD
ncbi:myogenic factor 6-like isoform X2 [Branchiostoma lanceolatum]|uniref:myogenic factor 6-like isoform X2 n=1 Tax=Branchiostoma lanceolatum TaxID=7740 RepID=UPI0034547BCF